jgi:AraC-like DNA-binding protein
MSKQPQLEKYDALEWANAMIEHLVTDGQSPLVWELGPDYSSLVDTQLTDSTREIMAFDELSPQERQHLLDTIRGKLSLDIIAGERLTSVAEARRLMLSVWEFFLSRALNHWGIVGSHMEVVSGTEGEISGYCVTPERAWALVYVCQGAIKLTSSEQTFHYKQGEAMLLSPGQTAKFICDDGVSSYEAFSLAFVPRAGWDDYLTWNPSSQNVQSVSIEDGRIREQMMNFFHQIIELSHSNLTRRKLLTVNLLENILILFNEVRPSNTEKKYDRRVLAACEYIRENFYQKVTSEDVADAANASVSALNTLFKDQMGMSLMRWRDQLRMQTAYEMLKTSDKSVGEIGRSVGYEDQTFFSRRFKEVTGWSPSKVRTLK